LKATFHPKFGDLETIKCPPGRAAAVPIETAQMKVKIRKNLPAELYFDFMAYVNPGFSFG
jgi:hypothetical protein